MRQDSQGKILIGGNFTFTDGSMRLARLNADGTLDNSFTRWPLSREVMAVEVRPDDKVMALGQFRRELPTPNQDATYLYRFNADGSVDSTLRP